MTTTENHADIQAQLADATREGTVTLELLDIAVESTHPDGYEGIPCSQGLRWISTHTQTFLELLEAASSSVEEFYRRHLNNFHVGHDLLNDEWLLLALGDERRAPFVREMFLATGDVYDHWLDLALRVNISRGDLAEMILEKLRLTTVDLRRNVSNFTRHAFMANGSGRMYRLADGRGGFQELNSYWGILDDEQLLAAMQIVANTTPNLLFAPTDFNEPFNVSEKLRLRLGDDKVNALLEFAAQNLQSLDLVSQDVLATLPLCAQLGLARRLTPFGTWTIQMTLGMGEAHGGIELLRELGGTLKTNSVSIYTWWCAQRPESDNRLSTEIERLLVQALKDEGYLTGALMTKTYKGRSQFQVRGSDGCTYIKDRHQTTYKLNGMDVFPDEGDVVLFRQGSGYPLSPGRLHATLFTLVHRPASK